MLRSTPAGKSTPPPAFLSIILTIFMLNLSSYSLIKLTNKKMCLANIAIKFNPIKHVTSSDMCSKQVEVSLPSVLDFLIIPKKKPPQELSFQN